MNRNEFNRFIAGIDLPGPGDLEGLRELTALFPWFHSAHLILLRGLKENSDIRFDSQLKASALSVSDREVLYHYLFSAPPEAAVGKLLLLNLLLLNLILLCRRMLLRRHLKLRSGWRNQ